MFFKNNFINYLKKFLMGKKTRGKVGALKELKALGGIKALLLLALNLFTSSWLANSSYFLIKIAKK